MTRNDGQCHVDHTNVYTKATELVSTFETIKIAKATILPGTMLRYNFYISMVTFENGSWRYI